MLRDGKACNSGLADTTSNRNEQCLKLASEEAYFILCCCWIDPFQCTYEPREKLLVEKNKMIWQELAKTRDPEIVLITESIISGSRDTKWSYYDFIYSFPQSNQYNLLLFQLITFKSYPFIRDFPFHSDLLLNVSIDPLSILSFCLILSFSLSKNALNAHNLTA